MIKIIGALLVIIASTAAGFLYGGTFDKRHKQLNEMYSSLHMLQNEIEYTHTTLPRAMQNVSQKSRFPMDIIFEDSSAYLYSGEAENVYDSFNKAIDKNKMHLCLKLDDLNILLDLAKTLGQVDICSHKKIFNLTLENLKKQITSAAEEKSKNVKMYRYLGFSAGAAIAVMLI